MKSTRSGQKWAHVSCALWIPEVSIGCVEKMEPITKISSIPVSCSYNNTSSLKKNPSFLPIFAIISCKIYSYCYRAGLRHDFKDCFVGGGTK